MASDDTGRELEKLRADVAALQDARRADKVKAEEAPPAAVPSEPPTADIAESAAAETAALPEEQRTQLEELGDLLQQEIRDLPTITCLAVFSLGILMGRLMR
ncbi:MAG: hypothetical protein QNJ00_08010 [Woeseiaceae bacterium]|nr:hypothetical protein [Woeseiaceae bacterium]MDJ0939695.1 hypothetical protein [Woeseiaceae bacterium]